MNSARKKVLSIAESYVGINVKPDSVARREIVNAFNEVRPQGYTARVTDDWCAEFVTAVIIRAFGTKIAKTYFPLSASCPVMIKVAKAKSIWKEKDSYKPQPGDLVLFDWDDPGRGGDNRSTPNHVGIVRKVEGKEIHTVEGNLHENVGFREFPINWRFIRGFICPKYEQFSKREESPTRISENDVVKAVLSGKYGTGEKQKKLIESKGYDPEKIRSKVARIKKLTNEVLKGKHGTGETRKKELGNYYSIVQWNVNRIMEEKK